MTRRKIKKISENWTKKVLNKVIAGSTKTNGREPKSCLDRVFSFKLSGIYTGEKTLYVVAIASSGDLKRGENFY